MNTPRKKKRFDSEKVRQHFLGSVDGHFSLGIHGSEAAQLFSCLVSEFAHLEAAMGRVLQNLIGANNRSAEHIFRSLISAKARIDIMRDLLQHARHNMNAPEKFDEIIEEFASINSLRNTFVHGVWYTSAEDGELYLIRPRDDPYLMKFMAPDRFDKAEFVELLSRIRKLFVRIFQDIATEPFPPEQD